MAKYGNKKVTLNGITFDSRKEAKRYSELLLLEKAGAITGLELQKPFELIPAQYERLSNEELLNPKCRKTKGKCLERAVKYKADFSYLENGVHVVEDTKGFKTKDYILKRKLMLWVHGIRIKEV